MADPKDLDDIFKAKRPPNMFHVKGKKKTRGEHLLATQIAQNKTSEKKRGRSVESPLSQLKMVSPKLVRSGDSARDRKREPGAAPEKKTLARPARDTMSRESKPRERMSILGNSFKPPSRQPVARTVPKPTVIDLDGLDGELERVKVSLLRIGMGSECFEEAPSIRWSEETLDLFLKAGESVSLLNDSIDTVRFNDQHLYIALQAQLLPPDKLRYQFYNVDGSDQMRPDQPWIVLTAGDKDEYAALKKLVMHFRKSVAERITGPEDFSLFQMLAPTPRGARKTRRKKAKFHNAEDNVVLQYPPNQRDVVTIYEDDVELLKPGRFLNDSIIAFYIKFLQRAAVPYALENEFYAKDNVHIFSSFFFQKLTEQGYKAVQKWTGETDIFAKDFLVIPINEDLHWYLVIVDMKQPCIYLFDSLDYRSVNDDREVMESVRRYLKQEWAAKKPNESYPTEFTNRKTFSTTTITDLPTQSNSSDCGVFLLHYLERFLLSHTLEGPNLLPSEDWFPVREIKEKRKELRLLITTLQHADPSEIDKVQSMPLSFQKRLQNMCVSIDHGIIDADLADEPQKMELNVCGDSDELQSPVPVMSKKEKRLKKRKTREEEPAELVDIEVDLSASDLPAEILAPDLPAEIPKDEIEEVQKQEIQIEEVQKQEIQILAVDKDREEDVVVEEPTPKKQKKKKKKTELLKHRVEEIDSESSDARRNEVQKSNEVRKIVVRKPVSVEQASQRRQLRPSTKSQKRNKVLNLA